METLRKTFANTNTAVTVLKKLGWIVNYEKCTLVPKQYIIYLGARLDLVGGMVYPTPERTASLIGKAQQTKRLCVHLTTPAWEYRALRSSPGTLQAQEKVTQATVPLSRRSYARSSRGRQTCSSRIRQPFRSPVPTTSVTTDATLSRWGNLESSKPVNGRSRSQNYSLTSRWFGEPYVIWWIA
ncbi:hypothetical protein BSL78_19172 [Apostichopus japonicus]|uniref:Uncharacterized protein n=1 Tax=Stichopus japonicus TaxID=307972 RepID=A0A2G8K7Q0_STIJA|nr:hypothetical protein BSL78_19172 [Apostichopus japonicus]